MKPTEANNVLTVSSFLNIDFISREQLDMNAIFCFFVSVFLKVTDAAIIFLLFSETKWCLSPSKTYDV